MSKRKHRSSSQQARTEFGWKLHKWRSKVKKRDGYKCLRCHSGTNLTAHHIIPFAISPELRFKLSNGVTLCRECHNIVDALSIDEVTKLVKQWQVKAVIYTYARTTS